LDYANNRHYDSQQVRFTQVDPAGMNATSLANPQTLNLYAYCTNDPINRLDPSGLGFFSFLGKVFNVIGKILKVAAVVVAAFLIFMAFSLVGQPWAGGLIAKALIEAGLLLTYALAPPKISAAVGILVGIFTMKPPIIFNLSETVGHRTLTRVLGILVGISSINDFLQQHKGRKTLKGVKGSASGGSTDPEFPCVSRPGAVTHDIQDIASLLGGTVLPSAIRPGQRFGGANIDPKGQSYRTILGACRFIKLSN